MSPYDYDDYEPEPEYDCERCGDSGVAPRVVDGKLKWVKGCQKCGRGCAGEDED